MQIVFLVGAPRSGTTWLQLLLHQHPGVVTVQETHVVEWYLNRLQRIWDWETSIPNARGGGLRCLLSEADFTTLQRRFLIDIAMKIAERKPGARIVLEKTPRHIFFWRLIHHVLPEARLLHIIRDPRAVAASMLRASQTWGAAWAPRSAVAAAQLWADALAQRAPMQDTLTEDYCEVRYEDLRTAPVENLVRIHEWLGLGTDPGPAHAALQACRIERINAPTGDRSIPWSRAREPAGFYREAAPDAWRDELPDRKIRIIEYVNRQAMQDLGYEPVMRPDLARPWAVFLDRLRRRMLDTSLRAVRERAPDLLSALQRPR